MRRSERQLKANLEVARTKRAQASAHYDLAIFHDNNSREARAIAHYRSAIMLGLPRETRAKALAYLASSLWKTGKQGAARDAAREALQVSRDPEFKAWIARLLLRIGRTKRGGS